MARNLQKLNISWTMVSDLGFLQGLPHLEELNLDTCRHLSSVQMNLLSRARQLQKLDISRTIVSDLDFLQCLLNLKELILRECRYLPSQQMALIPYYRRVNKKLRVITPNP